MLSIAQPQSKEQILVLLEEFNAEAATLIAHLQAINAECKSCVEELV